MMALGETTDSALKERLLSEEEQVNRTQDAQPLKAKVLDETELGFEVISERETLIFEDGGSPTLRGQPGRSGSGDSLFKQYILDKMQPGSVKGSMFTMTVSMIGAGVLALPYAVREAGFVLGLLVIILCGLATNFSLRVLLTCAEHSQSRSYMDLASASGGRALAALVQVVVAMNLFGVAVGYLVGGTELMQLAIKSFLAPGQTTVWVQRQALILLVGFVLVLPLSLFRSLESLRFTSLFSIFCMVFMTLTIVIKYFQFVHWGIAHTIWYQLHHLKLYDFHLRPLLKALPLVIFAYTCHPNVLPIYLVLKRRSSRRMYKVMNRSIAIASSVYSLCSAFVVLTFGEATKSNFLKNDYRNDVAILLGCIGFSIGMLLTVALFIHTLRDNLQELLCRSKRMHQVEHVIVSVVLVALVLVVALTATDIASVLSILGASTNPLICFVFPAIFAFQVGPRDAVLNKTFIVLLTIFAICLSGLTLIVAFEG